MCFDMTSSHWPLATTGCNKMRHHGNSDDDKQGDCSYCQYIIGRNADCMQNEKKALAAVRIARDVECRGKSSASMETKTPTTVEGKCV